VLLSSNVLSTHINANICFVCLGTYLRLNEEMLAAVFHGIEQGVRVEKKPIPLVRSPNDVLIEVQGCSICGTDAAILQGRHPSSPPVVLGHEYGGIVRSR
jgi:D-arabinose 1-dehydrogenase-like Zn-dependent alcohol dehydrogenase